MMDAPRPEARLRDRKPAALDAEQVGGRDAAIFVAHFGMATATGVPHHRDGANQIEARGIGGHDDQYWRADAAARPDR